MTNFKNKIKILGGVSAKTTCIGDGDNYFVVVKFMIRFRKYIYFDPPDYW